MDVDAVLVDQVEPHEGRGEIGAPETQVPAGLRLQRPISSASTSRLIVAFRPACSRVRENTILGVSRQIPANYASVSVAEGSKSAMSRRTPAGAMPNSPSTRARRPDTLADMFLSRV